MNHIFEYWQAGLDRLVQLSPTADLLLKVSLLLGLAWLADWTLRRANPRRRVLLWRGTLVGLLLLPLTALMSLNVAGGVGELQPDSTVTSDEPPIAQTPLVTPKSKPAAITTRSSATDDAPARAVKPRSTQRRAIVESNTSRPLEISPSPVESRPTAVIATVPPRTDAPTSENKEVSAAADPVFWLATVWACVAGVVAAAVGWAFLFAENRAGIVARSGRGHATMAADNRGRPATNGYRNPFASRDQVALLMRTAATGAVDAGLDVRRRLPRRRARDFRSRVFASPLRRSALAYAVARDGHGVVVSSAGLANASRPQRGLRDGGRRRLGRVSGRPRRVQPNSGTRRVASRGADAASRLGDGPRLGCLPSVGPTEIGDFHDIVETPVAAVVRNLRTRRHDTSGQSAFHPRRGCTPASVARSVFRHAGQNEKGTPEEGSEEERSEAGRKTQAGGSRIGRGG